jgi:hypothetical protein
MTYPVDPTTGQTHKPGPPLAICIVIIVVATAMGVTGLAVGVTKIVHEFSGVVYRTPPPQPIARTLTSGTYELFQGVRDGHSQTPLQPGGIAGVQVTGPSPVSVFRTGSTERIGRGGTSYLGIWEFKITSTGQYNIAVTGSPGEPFFISRSFGDLAKHAAGWFILMGAGILLGIVGVVLLIVGVVRRSRARKQAYAYTAGYPAAGYPPAAQQPAGQPPAGWYADPQMPGTMRWWDGTRWTDQTQSPP